MGRLRLVDRGALARYGAPAAFLLAVTIAVLLVRDALHHGSGSAAPIAPTTTSVASRPRSTPRKTNPQPAPRLSARAHYYVVRHGDNFYAVSLRFHLTLERLRSLNPGVDEYALQTDSASGSGRIVRS